MHATPRAKFFLWMVFQGRIPTYEYLYALKLGPRYFCVFCGLNKENNEHIFQYCHKIQNIWHNIKHLFSYHLNPINHLQDASRSTPTKRRRKLLLLLMWCGLHEKLGVILFSKEATWTMIELLTKLSNMWKNTIYIQLQSPKNGEVLYESQEC